MEKDRARDFQMTIRITKEMRMRIKKYISNLDDRVLTQNEFMNELLEVFFEAEILMNKGENVK